MRNTTKDEVKSRRAYAAGIAAFWRAVETTNERAACAMASTAAHESVPAWSAGVLDAAMRVVTS